MPRLGRGARPWGVQRLPGQQFLGGSYRRCTRSSRNGARTHEALHRLGVEMLVSHELLESVPAPLGPAAGGPEELRVNPCVGYCVTSLVAQGEGDSAQHS